MLTQMVVNFITRYEDGQCSEEEIAAGMQLLIDTGVADILHGNYRQLADELIDSGKCRRARINNPACPSGLCGLD